MKNYITPEMKIVSYLPEENMAATAPKNTDGGAGSNLYNDVEFGGR